MGANATEITKEKLYQEFNTVVAETEQLLKSVAAASGERAGALRASVDASLATATERIGRIRDEAVAQATSAAKATDQYVNENPWRAVGIVAAFAGLSGLLAGLLIARR